MPTETAITQATTLLSENTIGAYASAGVSKLARYKQLERELEKGIDREP